MPFASCFRTKQHCSSLRDAHHSVKTKQKKWLFFAHGILLSLKMRVRQQLYNSKENVPKKDCRLQIS
jgi:hypothetical protein